MTDWILENTVLLAAVAVLLFVGSFPAPQRRLSLADFPVLLLAVLCGAALVGIEVERRGFVCTTEASSTVKRALNQIRRSRADNLLLVDGGSYVQRGLDPALLTKELRRRGYSVETVSLALSAANHFERYEMHRDLVARLESLPHPKQRWVFLAEVQEHYDRQPLAQFSKNHDSARALRYLTPANAFHAFSAQREPGLVPPAEGPWRWDVLRHALINGFNVGVVDRVVSFDDVKPDRTDHTRSRSRLRGESDLSLLIDEVRHPTEDSPPPAWLKRGRERRLLKLWGERLDAFVYFAVPSTRVDQLKYARSFCRNTRQPCIAPTDKQLLRDLDSRRFWRDVGHLNRDGAVAYTGWLAGRLERQGVLRN